MSEHGKGKPAINYHLRDWSFSRQRYWGCPIPIVYCDEHGAVPVPEDELPVLLPEVDDYQPKGEPPLAQATEWINVPCPVCGEPARREADTMDTFVDSSWYFLRYTDPHNVDAPFDRRIADYWMPIDQYIGGIDHAKGHLLYSRFFMKALNDLDLIGVREPFQRLFHQGWVRLGGKRMSKSQGGVTPDDLIDEFGADPIRIYILFQGPADQDIDWTPDGIEPMVRFVRRLWRVVHEAAARPASPAGSDTPLARKAHETIARVTDDIGRRFVFNTPIAAVMELVNELSKAPDDPAARFAAETAVSLIQPYAPHVADELWLDARPRAAVAGAVAGRRRVAAPARHGRARPAGQRQGARPPPGAGRALRRGARRAREGLAEGAGASGRRRGPGDRRPGQARQPGRLAGSLRSLRCARAAAARPVEKELHDRRKAVTHT